MAFKQLIRGIKKSNIFWNQTAFLNHPEDLITEIKKPNGKKTITCKLSGKSETIK